MDKILYYPYINLPRTDWALRTLLYYESISSIVPNQYFYEPERNYEPFMLELVRNQLVIPVNPLNTFDNFWQATKPFIEFIQTENYKITEKQQNFRQGRFGLLHKGKFSGSRVHSQKFDNEIFYHLKELGLAKQDESNSDWYIVEKSTANYLMKFLASIISAKLKLQPATDSHSTNFATKKVRNQDEKREIILKRLIPFPQELDFDKVLNFKEKYLSDLRLFKNKIEQIVLDDSLEKKSELFTTRIEELELRKNELVEKMQKSKFKDIMFGTVCGIFGASSGLAVAETAGAVIGGLPGFANAIYSALKIEKIENTWDQSGMKYLALIDKKLFSEKIKFLSL